MPLVLCRHGERYDYTHPGWTQAASRPWDTPLTDIGHAQARAAAASIARHLEALGLPAAARVFSSPLLRCAETASNIASELGLGAVSVEPDLVETICENWYYS